MFSQSGWTRSPGKSWSQLSYTGWTSDQYFGFEGNSLESGTFSQRDFSFYGEYGVWKNLNVIVNAPILRSLSYDHTSASRGIGDLRIDLKYGLLQSKIPISIAFGAELPTGKANQNVENSLPNSQPINLPPGDGEWNYWTTLALSGSNSKMFGTAYFAYNVRTDYEGFEFADQLKVGIEVGKSVGKMSFLILKGSVLSSLSSSQNVNETEFLRQNGIALSQINLLFLRQLDENWGYSIGFMHSGNFPVMINNAFQSNALQLGLTYEIK